LAQKITGSSISLRSFIPFVMILHLAIMHKLLAQIFFATMNEASLENNSANSAKKAEIVVLKKINII
jgi:hypothetical protein